MIKINFNAYLRKFKTHKDYIVIIVLALMVMVFFYGVERLLKINAQVNSKIQTASLNIQREITEFVIGQSKLDFKELDKSLSVYLRDNPKVDFGFKNKKGFNLVRDRYTGSEFWFNAKTMIAVQSPKNLTFAIYEKKVQLETVTKGKLLFKNGDFEYSDELFKVLNYFVLNKRVGGPGGDPIITALWSGRILEDNSGDCSGEPQTVLGGYSYLQLIPGHSNNLNPNATAYIYDAISSDKSYEGIWHYYFTEPRVKVTDLKSGKLKLFSNAWFKKYPIEFSDTRGIEVGWTKVYTSKMLGLSKYVSPIRITFAGQSYDVQKYFHDTRKSFISAYQSYEDFISYIMLMFILSVLTILSLLGLSFIKVVNGKKIRDAYNARINKWMKEK